MTDHNITPRRRDRSKSDDAWIIGFLHAAPVGVIATSIDGHPYSHMNTFVYDAGTHAVYCHTAREGRFRRDIETNSNVCLSAYRMGRLLPADTAREFSVEYESVVIFGTASIVTDMALARDQMQRLMDKYFSHLESGRDYRPISDREIEEITVVRIDVEAWSGKGKYESSDFPGAFTFDAPPGP